MSRLGDPPIGVRDASVYVHFPYCAVKCPYCDFNSHVAHHDDHRYADAILRELDARGASLPVPASGLASVYFGGGTPSRWAPSAVGRVLDAIRERFGLRESAEITLEANPGTVVDGRLEHFRAAGINRFSIGCQSFDDQELAELGRVHDAEANRRAVLGARATGASVSIDLIYGLPGQDEPRARASVDRALALQPDHISAYTLTIEPETVLHRRTRLGLFRPMPDDEQARLIETVTRHLAGAGFERYEVSSYARDGRVSIHNTGYWLGAWYLGLGAGAHSFLPMSTGALRRENTRLPSRYLQGALGPGVESTMEEYRDPRGVIADRWMTVFRTYFGLDPADPAATGALADCGPLNDVLAELVDLGLVEDRGGRFRPTPRGFLFNDWVARRMLDAAASAVPAPH